MCPWSLLLWMRVWAIGFTHLMALCNCSWTFVSSTTVERSPSSRCVDYRPPSSPSTWLIGPPPHPQKFSTSCVPFSSLKTSRWILLTATARSTGRAFTRHHPTHRVAPPEDAQRDSPYCAPIVGAPEWLSLLQGHDDVSQGRY